MLDGHSTDKPPPEGAAGFTIIDFSDEHAEAFYTLNAEWITAMYRLEPHDIHILRHPRETILDGGGIIRLVQAADGRIVGTCALIRTGAGQYELTKMAVTESLRGQKAGEALLGHMIDAARTLPAERLYLLTNAKCEAAIHLYEKLGWVHDAVIMREFGATYARCDVAMSYPVA